jgi:integral membrane protein
VRRVVPSLFVIVAIAEAVSWAALLTGMVFKYLVVGNDIGVRIAGPIHGFLFMAYVVVTVVLAGLARWRWWVTLVALVCAVPPFATLAFERWARGRGLLAVSAAEEPATQP